MAQKFKNSWHSPRDCEVWVHRMTATFRKNVHIVLDWTPSTLKFSRHIHRKRSCCLRTHTASSPKSIYFTWFYRHKSFRTYTNFA